LQRGNTLAGGNDQVHGVQPLIQRYVRAFKDSASANGKVRLAGRAAEEANTFAHLNTIYTATTGANWFSFPAAFFQIKTGRIRCWETLKKFVCANCYFHFLYPFAFLYEAKIQAKCYCFIGKNYCNLPAKRSTCYMLFLAKTKITLYLNG